MFWRKGITHDRPLALPWNIPAHRVCGGQVRGVEWRNMTTQELRELDHFIAENVMGWRSCRSGIQSRNDPTDDAWLVAVKHYRTIFKTAWKPTIDPADAMEVLKKCAEKCETVCKQSVTGTWLVGAIKSDCHWEHLTEHKTIEGAICLFAKKLFSQPKP